MGSRGICLLKEFQSGRGIQAHFRSQGGLYQAVGIRGGEQGHQSEGAGQ